MKAKLVSDLKWKYTLAFFAQYKEPSRTVIPSSPLCFLTWKCFPERPFHPMPLEDVEWEFIDFRLGLLRIKYQKVEVFLQRAHFIWCLWSRWNLPISDCVYWEMRIWRKSNQKSVKYPESESVSVKGPISLVAAVPLEKVERKFIDFRLCLLRRESEWRFIAWLGWNFQKKGNERCCEERSEEEVSVCKIQTPTMGNISAGCIGRVGKYR